MYCKGKYSGLFGGIFVIVVYILSCIQGRENKSEVIVQARVDLHLSIPMTQRRDIHSPEINRKIPKDHSRSC